MTTFNQWLAEYTQQHGCPPAHVMAEAAFEYAYSLGYQEGTQDAQPQ